MEYTKEELKQMAEQNRKRFSAAHPASKLDIEILTDSIVKLNDNIAELSQTLNAQVYTIEQLASKKGK